MMSLQYKATKAFGILEMAHFFKLVLVVGTSFLACSSLWAGNPVYTVDNVKVDVKAKSAVEAQQMAMDQAHVKAFQQLLERMLSPDDLAQQPTLTADQIDDLVADYEVVSQKNSNVRFIATLTFRFDESAVNQYLANSSVQGGQGFTPIVSGPQSPRVVVPVFIDRGEAKLWSEDNYWFQAWAGRKKFSSMVPLVVPMGDLSDISDVNAEQALSGISENLQAIARRYGAGGVVVAIARTVYDAADPEISLDMIVFDLDGTIKSPTAGTVPDQGKGTTRFQKSIDKVIQELENFTQRSAREGADFNRPQQLFFNVRYENLGQWRQIQNALRGIKTISQLNVKSLSKSSAKVLLTHFGSIEALKSALGSYGLQLNQGQGATWEIQKAAKVSYPYS